MANNGRRKARYWILTIPAHLFVPYLPPGVDFIKGQMEVGGNTGYKHWQIIAYVKSQVRMSQLVELFGKETHCEPSKSAAVEDYVCKVRINHNI